MLRVINAWLRDHVFVHNEKTSKKALEQYEKLINVRAQNIPRYRGLATVRNAHTTTCKSGGELRDMMKVYPFLVARILPTVFASTFASQRSSSRAPSCIWNMHDKSLKDRVDQWQRQLSNVVCSFLDWYVMFCRAESLSESQLSGGDGSMQASYQQLISCMREICPHQDSERDKLATVKIHMANHYPAAVQLFGHLRNFSAEQTEHAHIAHIKHPYNRSNKKKATTQVAEANREVEAFNRAGGTPTPLYKAVRPNSVRRMPGTASNGWLCAPGTWEPCLFNNVFAEDTRADPWILQRLQRAFTVALSEYLQVRDLSSVPLVRQVCC
jgi:hypothetical protein